MELHGLRYMDYMDYGAKAIKRQTRAAHGCLVAGLSPWAHVWTVQHIGLLCLWNKSAAAAAACSLWRYVLYAFAYCRPTSIQCRTVI